MKTVWAATLLFILALIIPQKVFAQTYRMHRLTIDDGLSQGFIFCILQDSHGFMWFGTKDGLDRYDGYHFTVYRNDPNDSNSIPNDYVSALCETTSGKLWIGTALGGFCSFDEVNSVFHRYYHIPSDTNSITSDRISSIFEDTRGNLWVGTYNGLNEFGPRRQHVRRFLYGGTRGNVDVQAITEDKSGNLWISTTDGLYEFSSSGSLVSHFVHTPGDVGSIASNEVYTVLPMNDGSLWIGTDRSLDHYVDGVFTHYIIGDRTVPSFNVTGIVEDSKGYLWLVSNFTLVRFNTATGVYRFIRKKPITTTIYMDATGTLWLGDNGAGIDRFSPQGNRFDIYRGKRFPNVVFEPLIKRLDEYTGKQFAYPYIQAQMFFENRKKDFWIATLFDGLFHYDTKKGTFTRYRYLTHLQYKDNRRKIYFPYEGPGGQVWIGTRDGVARLNRITGKFHYYPLYETRYGLSAFERLSGSYNITCMYQDSSGILWVGTPAVGLVRFNPADGSRRYYRFLPGDPASLSSNFILTVQPDPRDPTKYLWIGTDGGGMDRLDMLTGRARHFTDANGLPNNVVYGILADTSGNLWLSTNRGICRFNPVTHAVRIFDVWDGLQSNEFNRRQYFERPDGEMFFGGVDGVNSFYPDQIKDNTHVPPVIITDFRIFNRSVTIGSPSGVLNKSISAADTIVVNYADNILTFRYAALDYAEPQKNRYAYELQGFNRNWIKAETHRTATFTNLDPGTYVFHVRGSNNDGVWNMKGRSVVLIVTPPFWMTTWFRLSAAVLVLLAFAGIVRYMTLRKIRERTRKLEQEAAIERERLRISRDMHDDIGSRLTELSLLSNLAERENKGKGRIGKALTEISGTANEIVTSLDEIVWAVNPRYDTAEDLMDYLAQFATAYLQRAGIECHVDLPTVEDRIGVPAETRHNVFMVLRESLNNIVKYAEAREVWLRFEFHRGALSMSVRDGGIGFDLEKAGKFSEGLLNMAKRMEEVGGSCEVMSRPGAGTTVLARIPLNHNPLHVNV